nr:DUF6707 family protein [Arthrobacter sp. YN]
MTHSPATQQYREKQAGDLRPGDFVYPPGDGPAAEIAGIEVQNDDYGVAALLLVTMVDGGTVRITVGSSVPVGDAVGAGVDADSDAGTAGAGTPSPLRRIPAFRALVQPTPAPPTPAPRTPAPPQKEAPTPPPSPPSSFLPARKRHPRTPAPAPKSWP